MPGIWRSLETETLGWSQGRWAVLVCAAHSLSGFTSPVSLGEAFVISDPSHFSVYF